MRIVILGAGTGGLTLANRLARLIADELERSRAEIVLVERRKDHDYQPGYLMASFGVRPLAHYRRSVRPLVHRRVRLIEDDVRKVDLDGRRLRGETETAYDLLIVATGSVPDFRLIPGLDAEDVRRPDAGFGTFYTAEGAEALARTLEAFERGRIAVVVASPVHKCPAAPTEFALLLDDLLRSAGRRRRVEIVYTSPLDRLNLLEALDAWARPEFHRRGIEALFSFVPVRADVARRRLFAKDGRTLEADLIVVVPPHRGADVVRNSGLGDEAGFLPTDPETLAVAGRDDVYAVGDATDLAFPVLKAGAIAHFQAVVLAQNLAHRLRNVPTPYRYDGRFLCFVDDGFASSAFIRYDRHHPPRTATTGGLVHAIRQAYHELYWLGVRGLL
ncbi:FAD-dependent oxidoreductase [Hydrogenibacillus schlegelii]|uniref:FAD/NAD(P)-binding domain-containing protein n=1 Tax=Hydrogenibacillus schlegelii TaxID=1484 RepID=A0A132MI43_HYDSH|nr:FAD-dependent oxidoreductase [Hydrogenibacillus schlegelii]KWW97091.1 hypothetical protein TR75_10660 [Hydrogenibacillus schlegelii]OAR03424.1 hypothetical protein SA87_01460 [Hydrogenibacillus schlegelii]